MSVNKEVEQCTGCSECEVDLEGILDRAVATKVDVNELVELVLCSIQKRSGTTNGELV